MYCTDKLPGHSRRQNKQTVCCEYKTNRLKEYSHNTQNVNKDTPLRTKTTRGVLVVLPNQDTRWRQCPSNSWPSSFNDETQRDTIKGLLLILRLIYFS